MFIFIISLYVLFLIVGIKKGLIFSSESCVVSDRSVFESDVYGSDSIIKPIKVSGGRVDYFNDGLHKHRTDSTDIEIG